MNNNANITNFPLTTKFKTSKLGLTTKFEILKFGLTTKFEMPKFGLTTKFGAYAAKAMDNFQKAKALKIIIRFYRGINRFFPRKYRGILGIFLRKYRGMLSSLEIL